METPQDLNIIGKAKNFGTAMANWAVQDGFNRVTDTQFSFRKQLCEQCPHWAPTAYAGLGQCKLCGCSGVKLYIPSSVCPDHPPRWGSISSPDTLGTQP